jgi:hypothetical protein
MKNIHELLNDTPAGDAFRQVMLFGSKLPIY